MEAVDQKLPDNLNLPRMGQLGIVAKSIDQALPFYTKMLNIRPWYRARIVKSDIFYHQEAIDLDLDIVVGYSGALQFELIEVVSGEENIYSKFLETQGEGVHHIGFVVSDIDQGVRSLKKSGFEPLQHGRLETKGKAVTRFAYFDTIDYCGFTTELIQITLFGINVGMSRWMIKLGRLLGDVDIINPEIA